MEGHFATQLELSTCGAVWLGSRVKEKRWSINILGRSLPGLPWNWVLLAVLLQWWDKVTEMTVAVTPFGTSVWQGSMGFLRMMGKKRCIRAALCPEMSWEVFRQPMRRTAAPTSWMSSLHLVLLPWAWTPAHSATMWKGSCLTEHLCLLPL